MATKEQTQITWSAANEITISNSNTWNLSDAIALNVSDFQAGVMVWADNQGTPTSGDTVDIGILYTAGEVDGTAGDDYENADNFTFLTQLDTYNNDDGNGVLFKFCPIETSAAGFKLCARAATGATRNVKVRARLIAHRGAIS